MEMFKSFSEWFGCVKSAASHLLKVVSLSFRIVFVGMLSVLHALWRFLAKKVEKYPSFALGSFLVVSILVWMLTFVTMRARAVGAEEQRDSISYQYESFKEQHGFYD